MPFSAGVRWSLGATWRLDGNLSTRALALIDELEDLPDLIDGEAERQGAADKREPLELVLAVESGAAGTGRATFRL
jgi:hypothetical protein